MHFFQNLLESNRAMAHNSPLLLSSSFMAGTLEKQIIGAFQLVIGDESQ